ncbi:MAG: hypothetical protein WEB88_12815 [Gemmatimonadota bacterium]
MRNGLMGLLVAVAVTGLGAADVAAQRRAGMGQGMGQGMRQGMAQGMAQGMGQGAQRAEQALRLREALDLTDEQVGRLETLRQQQVVHRQAMAEAGIAIRSKVAAGELTAVQASDEFQALRQSMRETHADGALREILTDEQHQILARQARANRAGAMRGGAGMRGGQGMRGRMAPGIRGGAVIPPVGGGGR